MKLQKLKADQLAKEYGTPLYVYDQAYLTNRASTLLEYCLKHNCLLRYAIKANPHPNIVKLFNDIGLGFDASSSYEAEYLIDQGVKPAKISLSSQQPAENLKQLLELGVKFVATSLHQLDLVENTGWSGNIAVRYNPGLGAGHSNRTNTGGLAASFGIWHEYLPQVSTWQKSSNCIIDRLHLHIGSGGDPAVWRQTIKIALELVAQMPDVKTLDIGGGYKVARVPGEQETDMTKILNEFSQELEKFKNETGRAVNLEIEPGTWLVANSGVLLSRIVDIVDTGKDGFKFIKLDTGMNDFLRPTLYGAQHPIEVLNDSDDMEEYVVVGHNCESGDILTPMPGQPELVAVRQLKKARIADLVVIGGAGAYAASMRAIGYNHFPAAQETFI